MKTRDFGSQDKAANRVPFLSDDGDNWEYHRSFSFDKDGNRNLLPRYTYDEFEHWPTFAAQNGYGDPTGTGGDENIMVTEKAFYEYHILGTQTILAPVWSSSGLNVGMDQTDNDGVELTQGITNRSKSAFVVGTDPAFFFEVQFTIADVSGTDDCAVGFRKAEAYQANIDDYDELACLNVISGDINIETILNGAATTTTDTTDNWADAASHTLKVLVDASGNVTYQIDGSPPTTVAAFAFDSGEVVVPFFYFLHASDVAGAVTITKWHCGLQ